jgi:anti-sigma factor ChrR (cupin superfamily)
MLVIEQLLGGAGDLSGLPWQPLRPGVDIHRLWGNGPEQPGAALLRYAPGGSVPLHEHLGHEEILVLSGWQVDGHRRYDAGTLFVNAPGTRHAVLSPEGCVVLAVWHGGVRVVEPQG